MMTVKYVDPDGPERVFTVKEIEYTADRFLCQTKAVELGRSKSNGRLRFIYPDGSDYYVYGGTVYAMNENGKTVAKYELGGEIGVQGVSNLNPAVVGGTFVSCDSGIITIA